MKFIVFDTESDGFWEQATKIHVLGYTEDGTNISVTHSYDEMRGFFLQPDTLFVAHNGIRHDMPLINKILGLKLDYTKFADTLALSWYLNFDRNRHGLEQYGLDYGVPKPEVDDWHNLTKEDYAHRVTEDVKINYKLWKELERKLSILYPDEKDKLRLIQYLGFKMDCLLEQEALKIKIDLPRVQKNLDELTKLQEDKTSKLSKAMPKKAILKEYNRPKGIYKKDGSLSEAGKKWFNLLQEQKLPDTTVGPINVIMGYQDGNPGSHIQVKDWLYSLGWKPDTWKYVKDKATGEERKIEQVLDDGLLSQSVIDLKEVDPTVGILEGLSIIQHRLSIFKGFLENSKGGFVVASASGLTNTLRFKHRAPIVNLPKVDKPYGEETRGCLIAPEGYTLCGADMVSLEDTTKRHYMQPFDPDYVKEMSEPGFDPHLNLARFAGAVTQQDIDNHNSGKMSLKALRHKFKQANYSAVYGIGAPKLARAIGGSVKEAKALLEAYWKRNHAVLKAVENLEVKQTGPYMWLKNPVSGFWYQLRSEKDKFSTLNQSTGVYAFDTWLYYCRAGKSKVVLQMHDEIGTYVANNREEDNTKLLKSAIDKTNDKLKLNVKLDIDIKYGSNYAATH